MLVLSTPSRPAADDVLLSAVEYTYFRPSSFSVTTHALRPALVDAAPRCAPVSSTVRRGSPPGRAAASTEAPAAPVPAHASLDELVKRGWRFGHACVNDDLAEGATNVLPPPPRPRRRPRDVRAPRQEPRTSRAPRASPSRALARSRSTSRGASGSRARTPSPRSPSTGASTPIAARADARRRRRPSRRRPRGRARAPLPERARARVRVRGRRGRRARGGGVAPRPRSNRRRRRRRPRDATPRAPHRGFVGFAFGFEPAAGFAASVTRRHVVVPGHDRRGRGRQGRRGGDRGGAGRRRRRSRRAPGRGRASSPREATRCPRGRRAR